MSDFQIKKLIFIYLIKVTQNTQYKYIKITVIQKTFMLESVTLSVLLE